MKTNSVRETSCLRAANDRVNEDIFSAGLRDLAPKEGWVAPVSVSRVGQPAEHTVLKSIASSSIRIVVPSKTKRSNNSGEYLQHKYSMRHTMCTTYCLLNNVNASKPRRTVVTKL